MNVAFLQGTRRGRLTTVLGADTLVLLRLSGAARLNGDSAWRVEALSADGALDLDLLVGTEATVAIAAEGGPAHFSGIVAEAAWAGVGEGGHRYDLTLRPWLHLAGLRRQQRIFHNRTVVEILTEVFAPYAHLGAPAVEMRLDHTYRSLEYTVQYRESDADFARRLMERFGISHHVRCHAEGHTLVLTDAADRLDRVPGGRRPYRGTQTSHVAEEEHFRDWRQGTRVTTGAVRLTDWNFKTPQAAMVVDRAGDAAHAEGTWEAYDWPGDHLTQGMGRNVADVRLAAARGQAARVVATGDLCSLQAGMKVQLTGDRIPGATGKLFVCLEAAHDYTAESYTSGAAAAKGDSHQGRYILMPAAAPLAPEVKTPVPTVQGPQTAMVVGDGEIDCDDHGRILVRFHWDLAGAHSMRCRVSQNWASQGWGGMVIPRIGMEVMVDFLDGDPDKPLVTGCVFNGRNRPPYDLPAHKTKSVFRTDSHNGQGTATGFNELSFEDAAGEEKIYLHAQRDHEIHVEHDRHKRVDRNQLESIGMNKTIEVGNNHHEVIGGNMTLLVGPNRLQKFVTEKFKALTSALGDMAGKLGLPDVLNMGEGNLIIGVAKNKAETVMLSSTEVVGAGKAVTVGGGFQTIVGGIANTTIGIGSYEEVGQNKAVIVGKQYEIVVGDTKVLLQEDGTVSITGKKILIDGQELVRITGKSVLIN
jgi:type VI secretion system secreted protein VgrG